MNWKKGSVVIAFILLFASLLHNPRWYDVMSMPLAAYVYWFALIGTNE